MPRRESKLILPGSVEKQIEREEAKRPGDIEMYVRAQNTFKYGFLPVKRDR